MQAISSVVNFKFKHPEKLSRKNKAKITRIYNEIGRETGYPIKVFKRLGKRNTQAALKEFNPHFAGKKYIKNAFVSGIDNQNTSISFRGKRPRLKNKKAKADINFFYFTDQEIATKNFGRLKKWLRDQRNPYREQRGKILTKDGDIYSKKINPTHNPLEKFLDFENYLGYLVANYGESLDQSNNHFIGEWLKGIEVVSFKKPK